MCNAGLHTFRLDTDSILMIVNQEGDNRTCTEVSGTLLRSMRRLHSPSPGLGVRTRHYRLVTSQRLVRLSLGTWNSGQTRMQSAVGRTISCPASHEKNVLPQYLHVCKPAYSSPFHIYVSSLDPFAGAPRALWGPGRWKSRHPSQSSRSPCTSRTSAEVRWTPLWRSDGRRCGLDRPRADFVAGLDILLGFSRLLGRRNGQDCKSRAPTQGWGR